MKEQLNVFAVCHNICFRLTRQVINLLKSSISNKNSNENNDNYYYYHNHSNKITMTRCRIQVFFSKFRQFLAYFGHPVYFGLSSNWVFFIKMNYDCLHFDYTVTCHCCAENEIG